MANIFNSRIVEDGWRNAIALVTGSLDTTDAALDPAVAIGDFTNNDPTAGTFYGFRVDHIWHTIGDGIEVQLLWDGVPDSLLFALAGRGRESFEVIGGIQPPLTLTKGKYYLSQGATGDISLTTTGFNPGSVQNFTVLLELIKLYH